MYNAIYVQQLQQYQYDAQKTMTLLVVEHRVFIVAFLGATPGVLRFPETLDRLTEIF